MHRARRISRRAFTLAESLLAAVLLALSAIAIFSALSASYQHQKAAHAAEAGLSLASSLMEQINGRTLVTSGGTGENTATDLRKYNGYTDTVPAPGEPTARYTRTVTIEQRASATGLAVSSGDLALVTVTVKLPTGASVKLTRLCSSAETQAVKSRTNSTFAAPAGPNTGV